MVNKYLECLAVEGNYSKARIGCLVLGLFSLGVFIWLIVLTVQIGQVKENGSGPPTPAPTPPPECKTKLDNVTETNPVPGVACIFPFKFNGTSHIRCTNVSSAFFWCATKVDDNGDMVKKQWGQCDDNCKKEGDTVKCYHCTVNSKNRAQCINNLKKGKVVECKNGLVCHNQTIDAGFLGKSSSGDCQKLPPKWNAFGCRPSAIPKTQDCFCDYDLCNAT